MSQVSPDEKDPQSTADEPESDEYYLRALDRVFEELQMPAYVTVARWSYLPGTSNLRLFHPGAVGGMDGEQSKCIRIEVNKPSFKKSLSDFSFTQLLVENDSEIWFHFAREDLNVGPETDLYLRDLVMGIQKTKVLEIAAKKATDSLVTQMIQEFSEAANLPLPVYEKVPLLEKKVQIAATLNAAIFGIFENKGCKVDHIYFIPLKAPAGKKRVVGILYVMTASRVELRKLAIVLKPLVEAKLSRFHFEEIAEERRKFSLRSAIAAIMSRNMSHNIGSHVLWHLSQQLTIASPKLLPIVHPVNLDKVSPFLSYLQKRMDFIAQVAQSPPSWCLVTNCNGLIDDFKEQACLVKNIIRSHQGSDGGPNFEPDFETTYELRKDPREGYFPDLDIPHGEIGAQAFYTILENIIRNTAKYGDALQLQGIKEIPGDGKLRFTIRIRDNWPGNNGRARDFCQIQIIEQVKTKLSQQAAVVSKLNGYLTESLTDQSTGLVNPKNWGMKEIKICAAYLRMVEQDQIDSKFNQWSSGDNPDQPPMIKVSVDSFKTNKDAPKNNLTYTLYLLRPKQALVVLDQPPHNEDAFNLAGIDFLTVPEFMGELQRGANLRHSFIVLPKPADKGEWERLQDQLNFLPPRVVIRDCRPDEVPPGRPQLSRSLAFASETLPRNPVAMMEFLWSTWVNRWWGDYRILVRRAASKQIGTIAERVESESWDDVTKLEPGRWIVFDHADAPDRTKLFELADYHQSFSSDSPIENILQERSRILVRAPQMMTSDMIENRTRLRLKEAAGISVAVIDERVWLEREGLALEGVRKDVGDSSRFTIWRKRRVFLQNTNNALLDFEKFVETFEMPEIPVFDFVIIHQGIIDTVRDKDKESFDRAWKRLKNRARWMVVDSGRGQPDQARSDNLRWVEYSNLAECLVQYAGDKLKLAELLWTLRASPQVGS